MLTLEAIMARTRRTPGGHRIWTGAVTGSGYPNVKVRQRNYAVHRLVVELTERRKLPRGGRIVAAHRPGCPTTCVAPDHVRRRTQTENILEGRRWA